MALPDNFETLTLSELIKLLPKEGWIKFTRSPTNNYLWWCCWDAIDGVNFNTTNQYITEAWGSTPEEATIKVLKHIEENEKALRNRNINNVGEK
jgi:hypothetical protein